MIPFPFAYVAPDTLGEAADAYNDFAGRGLKPLYFSGGTEIITMGRVNSLRFDAVIDLKGIPEMRGFGFTDASVSIGAAETLNGVACWNGFPLLTKCCQRIADHTAQCKITLGGNVAGTVIYREAALALLLAGAKAELYGPEGERTAELDSLFIPMLSLKRGEFFVRFHLDRRSVGIPFVHAKHVVSEKIGYPLFTLAAVRSEGAVRAAVSGLLRHPARLRFPPDCSDLSERIRAQLPEAPLSDASASADYRLFRLEGALREAMKTLGGCAT
ncbi:MAG: xanthine dehydrogenase [Clostridiales bacterium]|nr:xanthine dehydrogenase [Clostridiales bacterium]